MCTGTRRLHCAVALVIATAVTSFGQTTAIAVNDPRALAEIALKIEALTGIAINYEDAPYAYLGDMQDVGSFIMSPEQQAANPGVHHIWVPRSGTISIDLSRVPGFSQQSTIASVTIPSAAPLISAIIAEHAANDLPGVYAYGSANGAFYITPTSIKNGAGSWTSVTPVLDTKVTLEYQQRTAGETLNAIVEQVSRGSGVKIGLGVVPFQLLISSTVSLGATNETARGVLGRMLVDLASRTLPDGSAGALLAYHLNYDPGLKYCMMNIHLVPQPNLVPVAAPVAAPVAPVLQSNPYTRKK